jgi:cellulose synthase/poly-beta-1,6-N-acetylglucosamine synthase-like glycosyltransferase
MHGEAGILLWTVCYFFVVLVLSAYGIHRYLIIHLYFKNRHRKPAIPTRFDDLPVVTVQLPVYNEIHVIERLLKAIGEIEYPIEKLEIQVLDDSTDETYQLSQREVAKLRARGFDAVVLRRENRVGFKAGALDYGFQKAKGEFFFILDADFVPPPNILKESIDYFADPKVGMIQTRWGHINRTFSWLTRWSPCTGTNCTEPDRPILQFQRHRRPMEEKLYSRSGRLAARHADRRFGS